MDLAKKYCQGFGLEIGGSACNDFPGLNKKNVDLGDESWEFYKNYQLDICGKFLPIDIVGNGDNIPVASQTQDFVISSHVLEHFENPIAALKEWDRVCKVGGVIFMIVPHKERTFDKNNPRTKLLEVVKRYQLGIRNTDHSKHFGVWITQDLINIINWMNARCLVSWKIVEVEDKDSKVGNGFTIVCRKEKDV